MITLLMGENSFEIERALNKIAADFDGEIERVDGETLELKQLPDLLMGSSLFSNARTIFIRGLSGNKSIWSILPEWLGRVNDDTHVVLIEPKVDKRTATYKTLQKIASIREFNPWGARDAMMAEKWLTEEAARQNVKLDKKLVHKLVNTVGLNQWQLFHAIEKLALVDNVDEQTIDDLIDKNPSENAFELLEIAISGDIAKLQSILANLKLTEDPYQLFGLLSSQVFQLAVIANAGGGDNPSRDFGIHPFVISKTKLLAKKIGKNGVKKLLEIFVVADTDFKTSVAEPWVIIENTLVKLATNL